MSLLCPLRLIAGRLPRAQCATALIMGGPALMVCVQHYYILGTSFPFSNSPKSRDSAAKSMNILFRKAVRRPLCRWDRVLARCVGTRTQSVGGMGILDFNRAETSRLMSRG